MSDALELLCLCGLAGIHPLASDLLYLMPSREFSPDVTAFKDMDDVSPAFVGSDADLELAEAVGKGGVRSAGAEL